MKISKEQKLKNRANLLAAAGRICETKDLSNVSMKSISVESGLSDATIYKYFPTKDDLVLGFFEDVIEKTLGEAEAEFNSSDFAFVDKVKWVFDRYFENASEFQGLYRQIFSSLFVNTLPSDLSGLKSSKALFRDF